MIAGRPARTRVEVVPTQEVSDSLAEHTINSTCPKSTFHIGLHLRLDVSPVLHSIQIMYNAPGEPDSSCGGTKGAISSVARGVGVAAATSHRMSPTKIYPCNNENTPLQEAFDVIWSLKVF
ncbi:hypothetical protein B0H14DRAFT_2602591 [Mycena olivaceomarginata]|nr:hypothetical protein B0H14DRAFT_2602591 [Mycena olivaceomarginata]